MNVVVIVLLYFIGILFLGALALLPGLRQAIHLAGQRCGARIESAVKAIAKLFAKSEPQTEPRATKESWSLFASLHRNRLLVLAAMVLIATPVVLVFILRNNSGLDGYQLDATNPDSVIAGLLRGEQLVPPPPLPPEVFMTAEVRAERPLLATASRNWQQMDGDFEQRLLMIFKIMERDHGYKMVLLEGYRSPERQNMLAKMGGHVTNAGAFQSYHQYGLAADCAFMRDGKVVISEKDPWAMRAYQVYGQVAESLGLVWGGRWKMMDFGHVELRKPKVLGRVPATIRANPSP